MKKIIFLIVMCALNLNSFTSQNRNATLYSVEKQQIMLTALIVGAIAAPTCCIMVASDKGYCKWQKNINRSRQQRRCKPGKSSKFFLNGKTQSGQKYNKNHR